MVREGLLVRGWGGVKVTGQGACLFLPCAIQRVIPGRCTGIVLIFMKRSGEPITLPPLRRHEMPDSPATPLPIPPEKDTFVVPGETMTEEERLLAGRAVQMPSLLPSEEPDGVVRRLVLLPDPHLDGPEWGTAKRPPEIAIPNGRLLSPWDDETPGAKE